MCRDELLEKLGLESIYSYRQTARKRPHYPRQSGRTVETILQTIESLLEGKKCIYVVANRAMHAYVKGLFTDYLSKLEALDKLPNLSIQINDRHLRQTLRGTHRELFYDHFQH